MQCYQCTKVARAICRFCGVALCGDHIRARRNVSGWTTSKYELMSVFGTAYDYVVTENAVWCGKCTTKAYRKGKPD